MVSGRFNDNSKRPGHCPRENKKRVSKFLLMKHGALFGGIAGFCLAAQWAGIENVWYNDNEKYVCDVVRARVADGQLTDNIKVYEKDIREIGKHNLGYVDIIS
ncbi:MAG: DNA cytosine methyltransferase [Chloroflexi bacterium]|nr:DNA cytosine methyltransferase [Chloroflexota bacterium]